MAGNNPPDVVLELTRDEAQFLLRNCDTNIAFGLANLQTMERPAAEKLVGLIEQFKGLRNKLIKQGVEP